MQLAFQSESWKAGCDEFKHVAAKCGHFFFRQKGATRSGNMMCILYAENDHDHLMSGVRSRPRADARLELPAFCGQGLASMRSAGGKRHVFEEGSKLDSAGLPVH